MRNELLDLYRVLSTFPEVKEVLEKLKEKNYKLAILSNGTPSLLNELVKSNKLDNVFNDIFSIEEVKIYKPHSKVYNIPVEKYQIKKDEFAYLSANTLRYLPTYHQFYLYIFRLQNLHQIMCHKHQKLLL